MQRCLISTFVVQMSKEFSISSCFEPINVITLCTPVAQCIPPTSSFFYLLNEIFVEVNNKNIDMAKRFFPIF